MYERLARRAPAPPVLGAETMPFQSGGTMSTLTDPYFALLTIGMHVPFVAVGLHFIAHRSAGAAYLDSAIYSVSNDEVGPGRFTIRRATAAAPALLTTSPAAYYVDLDREVTIDPSRRWFVGLRARLSATTICGATSAGLPVFKGSGAELPAAASFGAGGTLAREPRAPWVVLLHRKGKRILCD